MPAVSRYIVPGGGQPAPPDGKDAIMKIVVLAGGLSPERVVSLATGANVCRALRKLGHRAVFVDMFLGIEEPPADLKTLFDAPDGLCGSGEIAAAAPDLAAVRASRRDQGPSRFGPGVLELCAMADIVFLGLHGEDGEDGRIQAAFDLLGIRYTGSGYLASGMAMDKTAAKSVMIASGIPTPEWKVLDYRPEEAGRLAEELPVPCVVKAARGGSSLGVCLPEDRESLRKALEELPAYGGKIFWEERVYGRELTVPVLGDRALPPVEILPAGTEFDYAATSQAGGAREICPADITEAERALLADLALRLHHALGLEVYSRTDFILDGDGRPWCLEVNSLPGMTAGSLIPKAAGAVGMSYEALCEEVVQLSYDLKRRD